MLPQLDPITAAVLQLAEMLPIVGSEELPLASVTGRVLAQELTADRDSPALNVSAMDGYALRLDDVKANTTLPVSLPVSAIATAGRPAPPLPVGTVVQIFTGAPVPAGADCIVQREHTLESPGAMQLQVPTDQLKMDMNIRFRGENARAGSCVLAKGRLLSSAAIAGVASVAGPRIHVCRRVRVAILNTGDELIEAGEPVQPWQIRDSNGPTLEAALANHPWIEVVARQRMPDSLAAITAALESHRAVDAVLFTGGVSMGDTDHVPAAIEAAGGQIIFHRLPMRPGKPVLGAIHGKQLIVGLPGNPVSVAVTARVVAMPLLRRLGGLSEITPAAPSVEVANADDKPLNLQWYRLVRLDDRGRAVLIDNRGSGDLISLAQSAGFIEQPAGLTGKGPWKFTQWT